jgi:hypothetical protein
MDLVPLIELEDDPVPIVMIIGAQLKRAMSSKSHRKIVAELDGCFALSSTTDPQKASVTISNGVISLRRGISPDAKIVIHLDFDNLSEKPRIERLLRHPLFAIQVGKLLEPPLQNWINEAKAYWAQVSDYPRMPATIKFISTTDNNELTLGDVDQTPEVIVSGDPAVLLEIVNGGLVFIEASMTGKINVNASAEHLVTLTEVSIKRLLGEI